MSKEASTKQALFEIAYEGKPPTPREAGNYLRANKMISPSSRVKVKSASKGKMVVASGCSKCAGDGCNCDTSFNKAAKVATNQEVPMHTAKNVEAQVKAAAPDLTKLAKHRVALAYSVTCGLKIGSTSTARRKMVEAFLTMPTFALEQVHQASVKTAEDMPPPPEDDAAAPPAEGDVPPAEGDVPPAEGDAPPAEGGDMMGGMDLGGGGGGMGGGMDLGGGAAESPEVSTLKSENEALVSDIQQLEQDFAKLQEVLPEGGALDLSSMLSEEAMDSKAEQLPEGGEGEDPALNLMPDSHEASKKSGAANDLDDDSFERELLGSLQGVDAGEQSSDPALPEQVGGVVGDKLAIFDQENFDEGDYADLPSNIFGDLAPAAGAGVDNGPAAPKAAGVKKIAAVKEASTKQAGARFLPSGTIAPPAGEDPQVGRLASLLSQF